MTINAEETLTEEEKLLEEDLQKRATRVLNHMNGDHSDSVKAYSMAFGEHPRCATETDHAKLTGLDRHGFFLQVTLKDGTTLDDIRVPYQGEVTSSKDLHKEAVGMHRKAYDQLGYWFKIRNGYYVQVAKMIGFQTYKKAKKHPVEVSAVAVAAASTVAWVTITRRGK